MLGKVAHSSPMLALQPPEGPSRVAVITPFSSEETGAQRSAAACLCTGQGQKLKGPSPNSALPSWAFPGTGLVPEVPVLSGIQAHM